MPGPSNKKVLNRILFPFLLLGLLVTFGISGFMIIEQYDFLEAMYMTIITIGSVGYEVVHPLKQERYVFYYNADHL